MCYRGLVLMAEQRVGDADVADRSAVTVDRAYRAGRVHEGDLGLLTSFGAGLSWGANLLRWTAA